MRAFFVWIFALALAVGPVRADGLNNPPVTLKPFNYVINGAMMVSQENGSTAGTTTTFYPVDQFFLAIGGTTGVVSIARVASPTPSGSPNRIRATVTTADAAVAAGDNASIIQYFEGFRVADLAFGRSSAKTITVQFGVRAPAGIYSVVVSNSGSTNRSYAAEYTVAAGEANTDVVKSVTIPGDTTSTGWVYDNGYGMVVKFGLMAGTTFQQAANSWSTPNATGTPNQFNFLGTVSNAFEIFDVGLYEGSQAPVFKVPDFAAELTLCQRHWHKSYDYGIYAGTASSYNAATFINVTPGSARATVTFPVPMRSAPSIVVYSASTGLAGSVNSGGSQFTTTAIVNIGEKGFGGWNVSGTMTSGFDSSASYTANSRL